MPPVRNINLDNIFVDMAQLSFLENQIASKKGYNFQKSHFQPTNIRTVENFFKSDDYLHRVTALLFKQTRTTVTLHAEQLFVSRIKPVKL